MERNRYLNGVNSRIIFYHGAGVRVSLLVEQALDYIMNEG